MNQTQLDGITKARLLASIALVQANQLPYADDAAYMAKVCEDAGLAELPERAADSYAAQHTGRTIAELEAELAAAIETASDTPGAPDLPTPTIAGVPTRVSRRQAKTVLELTPFNGSNLWAVALAAAEATPDPVQRIMTVNYLTESIYYERSSPVLSSFATDILGMTAEQIDTLFISAAAL